MEFHENYPVAKLIPYARNSRTHNDEQVAQIMASIKEFSFTNPILIGADDVIKHDKKNFSSFTVGNIVNFRRKCHG